MIAEDSFIVFVSIWIAIAIGIFPILLKVKQPYGRHSRGGFGPMIPDKLGWAIMELPSPIVFCWFYFTGKSFDAVTLLAAFLFILHYFNRAVIYPLRIKTKGKQMPLVIALSATLFNVINGFINGYSLGNFGVSTDSILSKIFIIVGIAMFVAGFAINYFSDHILINLRKPGETGYKIPKGFMFDLISCPNYFGEIIEWMGFAIATRNLGSLAFSIWVIVNLVPRAINHHNWYLTQFTDYPKERKIIIPKIF